MVKFVYRVNGAHTERINGAKKTRIMFVCFYVILVLSSLQDFSLETYTDSDSSGFNGLSYSSSL